MTKYHNCTGDAAEGVFERVYLAVCALCISPGDVRSRLIDAGIQLTPLMPSEFPPPLRADFEWIINQLTRFPARHKHEGPMEATMAKIQNRTGVKIAQRVLTLFEDIQKLRGHPII